MLAKVSHHALRIVPRKRGMMNGWIRSLSSNSSSSSVTTEPPTYSSFEYPTRTEAPEITQTKASDMTLQHVEESIASSRRRMKDKPKEVLDVDPFDDLGTMNVLEREKRKEHLQEMLGKRHHHQSSLLVPITPTVPDFVPPNVPSDQLQAPETIITTLDNGIRVISQESYGQMSSIGVLTNVGSRHETTTGTVHLLETMAFGSTKHLEGRQISEWLQDWGATRFVSHNREQTLHCIDILRPNVEQAMALLSEVVLEPRIGDASPDDFYFALDTMTFQAQEQPPQLVLGEALQMAAYGPDQQLGKFHFATPDSIPHLSPQIVESFYQSAIRHNPQQMVIAGAGISHDSLVDMTRQFFGHVTQQSAPPTIPSIYRGGYHAIPTNPETISIFKPTVLPTEQQCHVALAFPVGGWHSSDELVTSCVLQMLLGGGSSFSAGGPGKGMYSRLYRTVLNKHTFLESAEAFTSFAEEGGLLGVTASTSTPEEIPHMVAILVEQLVKLAADPVGSVELSRARNMLKCNVLTQLESRMVLFEDMGRQLLTYGKREDATTTCAKIDAVTAQDIQTLVQKMLLSTPTVASAGYHLDKVPSHEKIQSWFKRF